MTSDGGHSAGLGRGTGPSRRELLARASALGLGALLPSGGPVRAADAPVKGGTLRLGLAGGSTTDSANPVTLTDTVGISVCWAFANPLIEISPDNKPLPSLAESWDAKPGAAEWVFNLRKDVVFHNGKPFTAEDAIYSLNMHRGETKSGNASSMKEITDIRKLGPHQIAITLASGDADLLYVLSDYHMLVVPDGFTDWGNPIGTGAYTIENYQPGVRATMKKFPNFWRTDRGHVDACELTVINDASARINALISDQVDVINRVDAKLVAFVKKSPRHEIVQSPGGWHACTSMMADRPPFDSPDVRAAFRYAVDREQVIRTLFSGYGTLGNDHPIPKSDPYHNDQLPQRTYDLDKARFHLKKAGVDPQIVIQASDAAFSGAVDMATLFQSTAAKAGMKVEVKRETADGFWDNVWLKGSCVTSYWAGRSAATQMLAVAYKSDASWNEGHWRSAQFDQELAKARSELDETKRKASIWTMQEMLYNDGATVIPVFKDWLDAHSTRVGGHTPHTLYDVDNGQIVEKAWLKA